MGKIVRAVAAVALVVAGVVTANPALIAQGVSIGSTVLAPRAKAPRNSAENANRLRANIDPLTPRKTAVGITALATDIRDEEFTDNQEQFHRFIVCAGHKAQSIDEIWFDDELAWSTTTGIQSKFFGYLGVETYAEGSAATAKNISPRMGSTRRYTGLAYVYLRYKLTGNSKKTDSPFAQSIPTRITIRGRGAMLPDPRNPAHDMGNQSTWTWNENACRNPALALLFYLLGWRINGKLAVGKGIPADRIDLDSFITAANLCDELVPKPGGGTEPRYRCDGLWSEGDSPSTVIDMLKACMNADLDDVGGKLRLTVFHNDLATPVADFGDNDIIDAFSWQSLPPLDSTFNVVRGVFTDPSDAALYQQVDYPEQREDSPDGIDRIDTFNLPMVQSAGQAQRLAQLRLQRQKFAGVFEAEFQANAWKVTKNSVIRLTFGQTGFVSKFFRVAQMEIKQDGRVPLVLREEDPAIYGDPPLTGPITPTFSTPFDPARSPFVQAINRWQGEYSPSATYVLDDLVTGPGNAGWRFVGATPAAGAPLPVWPAASNAFWENFTPPLAPEAIGIEPGATRNTGAINADGLNAIDAGGPLLIGELPTDKADPGLRNSLLPLGNANRVPFSRMEGDQGWAVLFNPAGLANTPGYGAFENRRFFVASVTATAAGQTFSIGSNVPMRVTADERLSVQARLDVFEAASAGGVWLMRAFFRNGAGAGTIVDVASGNGPLSAATVTQGFITVPAGQVSMTLELVVVSGEAGAWQIAFSEPMVTSAAAGQTVHPPFSPGPNAFDGATVGAPAGTFVAGVEASAFAQDLATAKADAAQSQIDLGNIANDGRVTVGEKISVRERRANIANEFPIWRDRAIAFGVDSAIRTNFQAAFDALNTYLDAININANTTSTIVRADFVAGFNNYALWRERIIEAISQIASQRALWDGVTGAGRPENNADVTAGRTAAAISGQAAWATYNGFQPGQVVSPGFNLITDPGLRLRGKAWNLPSGWNTSITPGSDVGYYAANTTNDANMRVGDRVTISPNNHYTFSIQNGGQNYSGAPVLQLNFYDGAGAYITQVTVGGTAQGLGYLRSQVSGLAPANAVFAECFLKSPGGFSSGGFYVAFKPKLELGTLPTVWREDNTSGALYDTGDDIDTLRPGEAGANITEGRVAAAISGQGSLATANSAAWGSQITGRPAFTTDIVNVGGLDRLNSWYVRNPDNGSFLTERWPAELGANVTEGRVAAAISGQGDLATRSAASLPFGSNAVVNSDFTRGKFGWRWRGGGFENSWGVNLPGWHGQRNVIWATVSGVLGSGGNADLSPDAIWQGSSLANAPLYALPVVAGDWVYARVLMARHRCDTQLFLLVFDAAGTLIQAPVVSGGTVNGAGDGDPSNFTLLSLTDTIGANARWAIPMIRMVGTGEADPYMFFTEPAIGKIAPGQTAIPAYTSGRSDPLGDQTATNTAAFISGQQPWATSPIPTSRLDFIDNAGRSTSRRFGSQITASGLIQLIDVNPITASTDGSVSTITINAHSVFDDAGTISFTSASIGGLAPNTLYYVYEFNPDFAGGARSYVATTNRNDLTAFGRRYVGIVTTPDTGSPPASGGGGGGGVGGASPWEVNAQ